MSSLKSCQLNAIHRMLSMNESAPPTSTSTTTASTSNISTMNNNNNTTSTTLNYSQAPAGTSYNQWKILIYDKPCQAIISPLLTVSQLRSRGVTLHLNISSHREPIPDVPAIYFVEPTRHNLQLIAQDIAKDYYQSVHLNFSTKLDRSLMEEFAKLVVETNSLHKIASVHDQYLDFVSLEQNLFQLANPSMKESYVVLNGGSSVASSDEGMERYMDEISYGLLSVVGALGVVPIIRCPKGGAPEMVARKLNKIIAEHPNTLSSTSTTQKGKSRPLLVIFDRNMDLITPTQHSSTYQALIDDLLVHKANRVEFTVEGGTGGASKKRIPKKFDLDADGDPFYSEHKFKPFPEAIENNGAELQDVTTRENTIRSKAGGGDGGIENGTGANGGIGEDKDAANDLATAVDSLPELLEQKKQLEVHTSILQAVMNEVARRDVPQFFELESSLATGQYKNDLAKAKKDVLELVTDVSKGNVEDKLRLVICFCLATTTPGAEISDVASQMAESLERGGSISSDNAPSGKSSALSKEDRAILEKGLKAIEYLKNLRSMQMIPTMSETQSVATSSASGASALNDMSSLMTRAAAQTSGFLAKATEKVTSMLGKIHKHHATRVVENLCDMKLNTEDDDYLYLDPRVKGDVDVNALRNMTRVPVNEVVAFVIGGGCYSEYQNLQMVANENRTITYGSTELLSPCEFLDQLGKLS